MLEKCVRTLNMIIALFLISVAGSAPVEAQGELDPNPGGAGDLPTDSLVELDTSEWGPIGIRALLGRSSDGSSGGISANIYPTFPSPQAASLQADSLQTESPGTLKSNHRSIPRFYPFCHHLEFDLGHAKVETDAGDFPNLTRRNRELGVFFLSAGCKLRKSWRIGDTSEETIRATFSKDDGSSQVEDKEHWKELRLLGGYGVGFYDFEGTGRPGAWLKIGGQYAFARHASEAIELSITFHYPSSAPRFQEIKLGYVWHLPKLD